MGLCECRLFGRIGGEIMFTRHAKDLLRGLVIIIVVLSICVFGMVNRYADLGESFGAGFVTLFVGITLFTGVGMKVEQANEVMDLNEKMSTLQSQIEKMQADTMNLKEIKLLLTQIVPNNTTSENVVAMAQPVIEKKISQDPIKKEVIDVSTEKKNQVGEPWICENCLTMNKPDSLYCMECGQKR